MGATLSQQLKSRRGTSDSPSRRPGIPRGWSSRLATLPQKIRGKESFLRNQRQLKRKLQLEENSTLLIPRVASDSHYWPVNRCSSMSPPAKAGVVGYHCRERCDDHSARTVRFLEGCWERVVESR